MNSFRKEENPIRLCSPAGFIRIGEPSERGIRGESRIPMSIFTTGETVSSI